MLVFLPIQSLGLGAIMFQLSGLVLYYGRRFSNTAVVAYTSTTAQSHIIRNHLGSCMMRKPAFHETNRPGDACMLDVPI